MLLETKPQSSIHDIIRYDPESGDLFYKELKEDFYFNNKEMKKDKWNRNWANKKAGSQRGKDGYRTISILKKKFYAHRLAFYLMHNRWPKTVDHINLIKYDNRWSNLREATHSQNNMNSPPRKNKTSKYKGVNWNTEKKTWVAQIRIDKKTIFLGYFETEEAAFECYKVKALELRGDFASLHSPVNLEFNTCQATPLVVD